MRKVLLVVLSALIIAIMVMCMKNGLRIGSLEIPSFQGIHDASEVLTAKIGEAEKKENEYNDLIKQLSANMEELAKAKSNYLDLVSISSANQIQEATQSRVYAIEYLWSRVGNHATKNGVTIKMDVQSANLGGTEYKNLSFTANGEYLAMTNFIAEIENDTTLDFTIDEFDMTLKQCTFVVKDIRVHEEKVSNADAVAPAGDTSTNTTTTTTTTKEGGTTKVTTTTETTQVTQTQAPANN